MKLYYFQYLKPKISCYHIYAHFPEYLRKKKFLLSRYLRTYVFVTVRQIPLPWLNFEQLFASVVV